MRLTDLVFLVELKIQHGTIVCYLLVLFRFTAIASCLDGFSNLCFELMGLKGRLRHIYTATETDRAPKPQSQQSAIASQLPVLVYLIYCCC